MRASKEKLVYAVCMMVIFLWSGSTFGASSSEPLLPDGLVMDEIYKPGRGLPVGKVLLVQGRVVIMHADMERGYLARKDLLLYKGDKIVTQERSRIRYRLNDESILTLASNTKMTIDQSIYDRTKKSRFSFLGLNLGKARFWVRKLANLRRSEFKVRTPTAILGVRGSDFIVKATPNRTEITALDIEKMSLEVLSLSFPEADPLSVRDFERTIVEEGILPSPVERVAPEEIERLKRGFVIGPEVLEGEARREIREKEAKAKEAEDKGPAGTEEILISDDELARPDDPGFEEELGKMGVPPGFEQREVVRQEEEILEQQEDISEEQHETATEAPVELPGFPGTPE